MTRWVGPSVSALRTFSLDIGLDLEDNQIIAVGTNPPK
jgi:hypothetical protein